MIDSEEDAASVKLAASTMGCLGAEVSDTWSLFAPPAAACFAFGAGAGATMVVEGVFGAIAKPCAFAAQNVLAHRTLVMPLPNFGHS